MLPLPDEGWPAKGLACSARGAEASLIASGSGPLSSSEASAYRSIVAPTAMVCPGSNNIRSIRPAKGDGRATAALSVSTSAIDWPTATSSCGATSHSTSSASKIPSPSSGSFMSMMGLALFVGEFQHCFFDMLELRNRVHFIDWIESDPGQVLAQQDLRANCQVIEQFVDDSP